MLYQIIFKDSSQDLYYWNTRLEKLQGKLSAMEMAGMELIKVIKPVYLPSSQDEACGLYMEEA